MTEVRGPLLELARPDDIVESVALGPDPRRHLDLIASFATAGFNQVLAHETGPDQEGFLRFYAREIMPALGPATT